MAKTNDTSLFPITTPAVNDLLFGTDVSNTTNSADGETVNFTPSGLAPLFGIQSVQVFTSSGTWTKPSGVNKVLMFVTGGGNVNSSGGGGGAGGTAIKLLDVSSIASATITVGNNTGGDSSWVDSANTITGGGGGKNLGGTATGGDLNITGGFSPPNLSSNPAGSASFWGASGAYGSGYGSGFGPPFRAGAGVVLILEFA